MDQLALDLPFSRARVASAGLSRSVLERMLNDGVVRRVLRGVYVRADQPDTMLLRARALGVLLSDRVIVVDRTAAWVHGLDVDFPIGRLDVLGRRRDAGHFAARRELFPGEVEQIGGVRVTSVLRTVMDLARLLGPDRALALLDSTLHQGLCRHRDLVAALPGHAGLGGAAQLSRLVALADTRPASAAESVLRLRWLAAGLPTPVPQLWASGVAVTIGLPIQRFGVQLGELTPAHQSLLDDGWRLLELAVGRVVGSDAELVEGHLSREYHRHLQRGWSSAG